MACPVLVSHGVTLGHGTPAEAHNQGTKGLGLSSGATVLTVWDDITYQNGNVAGGHPTADELGFTVLTFPGLDFIGHYVFGTLGVSLFSPVNLTTDDDGNVYYFDRTSPAPNPHMIKQTGASWANLDVTSRSNNFGPCWNPYDGLLYNVSTVGTDRLLEWWDTSTGFIDDRITPALTGTDAPTFTPDGGVWLSMTGVGDDSGMMRYDIPTDTWDSVAYTAIPPIFTDSCPVPTPDSTVLYRDNVGDQSIEMAADFSYVTNSCAPWTAGGVFGGMEGQSRVAHSPSWTHTAFIAPSTGGFGTYLWDLGGAAGGSRWGSIGWAA